MKAKHLLLLLLLFLIFSGCLIAAQRTKPRAAAVAAPDPSWRESGLEINNTPGNTSQQNPTVINGEPGFYYLVWEDGRNGYVNLFAQKIEEKGA